MAFSDFVEKFSSCLVLSPSNHGSAFVVFRHCDLCYCGEVLAQTKHNAYKLCLAATNSETMSRLGDFCTMLSYNAWFCKASDETPQCKNDYHELEARMQICQQQYALTRAMAAAESSTEAACPFFSQAKLTIVSITKLNEHNTSISVQDRGGHGVVFERKQRGEFHKTRNVDMSKACSRSISQALVETNRKEVVCSTIHCSLLEVVHLTTQN